MNALETDDIRARLERESMQKLIEIAFKQWQQAHPDQKVGRLLTGSALVWAERWLLSHPDEVSIALKNFILRSLANHSQKLSSEWLEERRELQRKDTTYNRIIIVASLLALAVVAPTALRDAGLWSHEATPAVASRTTPAAGETGVVATPGGSEPRTVVVKARPRVEVDDTGEQIDAVEPPTAEHVATLAANAAAKGDRRTSRLLAVEYLHLLSANAATPRKVTPVMWGNRELPVQIVSSITKTSELMNALAERRELAQSKSDNIAHHRPVMACDGSTRLVAVTEARRLMIWDASNGHKAYASDVPVTKFSPAAVDRGCQHWASVSDDHEVMVTALVQGAKPVVLGKHDADIFGFAFDAHGSKLATVSHDGVAKVWDTKSGRKLAEVRGVDETFLGVTLSPDGARLVLVTDDKIARVYDVATGRVLGTLDGHSANIDRIAYNGDGRRILTHSADGSAILWNAATLEPEINFFLPSSSVVHARLTVDEGRAALVTTEGLVEVWDNTKKVRLSTLGSADYHFIDAVFSQDGALIATTTERGEISIWNAASGAKLLEVGSENVPVAKLAFSPDAMSLQAVMFDGSIAVWPLMVTEAAGLQIARQDTLTCLLPDEREKLKLDARVPAWCDALAVQ